MHRVVSLSASGDAREGKKSCSWSFFHHHHHHFDQYWSFSLFSRNLCQTKLSAHKHSVVINLQSPLLCVVTLDASCSLIRDNYSYLRREYQVDQPQCRRVNILVCEEHIHPWCRRWRGLQLLWLFQLVELSFSGKPPIANSVSNKFHHNSTGEPSDWF